MKNILGIFTIFCICLLGSCKIDYKDSPKVDGSDNIVTVERTLSSFDNVVFGGVIGAEIKYGDAQKVEVTANDNIIDNIKTEVNSNTLFVKLGKGNYGNIDLDIAITMPNVIKIKKSGVGGLKIEGFDALDELTIDCDGVSNIQASGQANLLTLNSSNVGNFNGFEFKTKKAEINQSSLGNIEIYCSESLNGKITGVGNLFYKGNPEKRIVTNSGLGKIIDAN